MSDACTDGQIEKLVEEWEEYASMYGSHQRETFNARCETYAQCAEAVREALAESE